MKNRFLSVFLVIVLISSFVFSETAAASDADVDIGTLINDPACARDWEVSGSDIDRSQEDYARVSGVNTIAGYSACKIGDETVKLRFRCTLDRNDGWIAYMLRSDTPTQAPWTARHVYNLLFRSSQVELQRWIDGNCTTLARANLAISEDESFKLRFSARNENGAVILTALINDEEIINFTDTADPIAESGYFSIMTFNNSLVDIYADSDQPGTGTAASLITLQAAMRMAASALSIGGTTAHTRPSAVSQFRVKTAACWRSCHILLTGMSCPPLTQLRVYSLLR
jgi:hypothetical protein